MKGRSANTTIAAQYPLRFKAIMKLHTPFMTSLSISSQAMCGDDGPYPIKLKTTIQMLHVQMAHFPAGSISKVMHLMQRLSHDLLVDELLQLLLAEVILVLIEVEELLWDRAGSWLIVGIMVWLEIGVLECLINGDTLDRVESKEFLKEVKSEVGGLGEHLLEWDLLLEWEGADVLAGTA